jgi:hypothetical protein
MEELGFAAGERSRAALSSDIADRIFPLAGHPQRWKVA